MLREALETLVLLLSPFTPHVCEEMWERLGPRASALVDRPWPVADADVAREDEVELAVQVNGKVRGRITRRRATPRRTRCGARRSRSRRSPSTWRASEIVKVVVVPAGW